MEEIWKDIPGYEEKYEVSNLGRVKSLERIILKNGKHPFISKEKILKPYNSSGKRKYFVVSLCYNGKIKKHFVHQLVYRSFKDLPLKRTDNMVIDHKDNNPKNNKLSNLQITTQRINSTKDLKQTKSKYVGVSFHKRDKKWHSKIRHNGKRKYLGYHDTEIDAHLAYQKALKELDNKTYKINLIE